MNPNSSSNDTTKVQRNTNDSIQIYYTLLNDTTHQIKQLSSLKDFTMNKWYRDLGNTGTSYSSLLFQPTMQAGREIGMFHKQAYLLLPEAGRFYNTTRPYTDIYYNMGTKQEQIISLLHTQNIQPNWNIALSYTKLVSPGQFKFIRSNHDQAMINTWYVAPNHRYQLKVILTYNKQQQDENGGLLDESLLANPSYYDRRLIPVLFSVSNFSRNRSAVMNYYRQASFHFLHSYDLGHGSKGGSAFKLTHRFYSELIFQYYKDQSPDSAYYGLLYQAVGSNSDSLYDHHGLKRYGNAFSLQKEIRLGKSRVQLESGYGIETDQIKHQDVPSSFLNQYIFASLLKQKEITKPWYYQAQMKFYFSGNAAANMLFHSTAGRALPRRLGIIEIGFDQSIQSPSYKHGYYQEIRTNTALRKMLVNNINATYSFPKRKFSLSWRQFTLAQYTYVDTNWNIQQDSTLINIQQVQLQKNFMWGKFHLDNEVILQHLKNELPLHLPMFLNHHKFYFGDSVFKRKLSIETGVAFTYNSPFQNDLYLPVFQSFTPQYNRTIYNIPMLSAFFHFGLKKFQASIALDELQQLYADNNLNYTSYPRPNFMMRFKLNWVFIN